MFLHTNLVNRKVLIRDTEDVPEHHRGKPARIVSVWLDPQVGVPKYTLAVEVSDEPLRELWDCSSEQFGANK